MKEVLMMVMAGCPHCRRANQMLERLMEEHEEYRAVTIRREDENMNTRLAESLDYYYVPCFFVDGKKMLEGVPTLEGVEAVLRAAVAE
ncbi:MAG: thioredoxin family protein [Lachnospiraceae bacterium]|nr:thioredoxin family protein [Lachnospiraceae bacterium]